jgi:hypothetical protein
MVQLAHACFIASSLSHASSSPVQQHGAVRLQVVLVGSVTSPSTAKSHGLVTYSNDCPIKKQICTTFFRILSSTGTNIVGGKDASAASSSKKAKAYEIKLVY